jgi:thiol-disulfide isomerase/thioredoxin
MKRSVLVRAALVVAAAAVLIGALNADLGWFGSGTLAAVDPPVLRGSGGGSQTAASRELRALDNAAEWINSPPLTSTALRGKVVLIDFWTYTCVNWMRTLPYVRAWAEKYGNQGLVVVSVHTPEFSFESDIANVRRAAGELKVGFPIVVDNNHAIWNAFRNQYWPALYLIDGQGRVRYTHFGEGEYERSERAIQQVLAEATGGAVAQDLAVVKPVGVEVSADLASLQSPETYAGYERTSNFSSPGGAAMNKRRVYTAPKSFRLNQWALSGDWTMSKEAARLNEPRGRVVYRFQARDVNLVMGPARAGTPVRFRVLVDGQVPAGARGGDIDAQGNGTVTTQRLYQLLRQPKPINARLFEIEFLDPGVEVFSFTFG